MFSHSTPKCEALASSNFFIYNLFIVATFKLLIGRGLFSEFYQCLTCLADGQEYSVTVIFVPFSVDLAPSIQPLIWKFVHYTLIGLVLSLPAAPMLCARATSYPMIFNDMGFRSTLNIFSTDCCNASAQESGIPKNTRCSLQDLSSSSYNRLFSE